MTAIVDAPSPPADGRAGGDDPSSSAGCRGRSISATLRRSGAAHPARWRNAEGKKSKHLICGTLFDGVEETARRTLGGG